MITFMATALLAAATPHAQSFIPGQLVKTTSGDVKGQASSWKPAVSEYLGIPFAQPPLGPLRWAAPIKFDGAGKTIDATKAGAACLAASIAKAGTSTSQASSAMGGAEGPQSEDCLFLNVYTKPQSGEKKKAVMLWIHGGAFIIGSGSNKGYNGALLAQENDVVVVTMNYRLGVFGYPNQAFIEDKNPGLLDQRLAVEWVRDNIDAFGGDPSRITLFGQSAGAASVDYYAYAYTKDPIVHALIAQSGTVDLMKATSGDSSQAWFKASATLGCGAAEAGAKTVDCLRTKTGAEILSAVSATAASSSSGRGLNFGGFIPKPDGVTVFNDYPIRLARGEFIKVPMLIGNTENEMATFAPALGSAINALVSPRTLNAVFSCPAGTAAKAVLSPTISGPFHGSEIALIFGTADLTKKIPDTAEQRALGVKLRDVWTAFAKDPQTGLDGIWPKYDLSKPTVVILGGKDTGAITYKTSAQYDSGCGIVNLLGKAAGGSIPKSNPKVAALVQF